MSEESFPVGSGSAVFGEVLPDGSEFCQECGQPLGESRVAFFDGTEWRRVHVACVPE